MHSFIRRENLKRYRNLLTMTSDEEVRGQLCKLIAEEERRQFFQRILEQQSVADNNELARDGIADLPSRHGQRRETESGKP